LSGTVPEEADDETERSSQATWGAVGLWSGGVVVLPEGIAGASPW
jgi:hypothetical protein